MITCRKAAELSSRELDAGLSLAARLAVGVHCVVCGKCRTFRGQVAEVNRVLSEYVTDKVPPGDGLPADARDRIRVKLREKV